MPSRVAVCAHFLIDRVNFSVPMSARGVASNDEGRSKNGTF
jgi:hypothetical protein